MRRRAVERRYELLPYLYTAAEEMSRTGVPMMRPLFLEYPRAPELLGDDRDFLLGRDLLVLPAFSETSEAQDATLPPGAWYEDHSSTVHESSVTLRPALGELPVYVRAGAVVPEQPVVQDTDETPSGPLELRVYPGPDCRGALYQDDGHTFAYRKGELLRVVYSCAASPGTVAVESRIEADGFKPWWRDARLTVYGIASAPREVRVRGAAVKGWAYDPSARTVVVDVPKARGDWRVEIRE
jgi:alpha-glucosidase